MSKLRLTKTELKRQKDGLKSFRRYLPTLNVKKKLLQKEVNLVSQQLADARAQEAESFAKSRNWLGLLAGGFDIFSLVELQGVQLGVEELAGLEFPKFEAIQLKIADYDLYQTPFWVDGALELIQQLLEERAKLWVLETKSRLLAEELTTTSQRINLFEKVKIPQTLVAIKTINTYLDDQQTMAVGWALGAKKKIEKAEAEA